METLYGEGILTGLLLYPFIRWLLREWIKLMRQDEVKGDFD